MAKIPIKIGILSAPSIINQTNATTELKAIRLYNNTFDLFTTVSVLNKLNISPFLCFPKLENIYCIVLLRFSSFLNFSIILFLSINSALLVFGVLKI